MATSTSRTKERFPDELLDELLQHFEKYRLHKVDVGSSMVGDAYEYLIAQFADDAGKKGGEFYTPKQVVRLMVEVLRPEGGMTVYDPTAAPAACCSRPSTSCSARA